MTSMRHVNRIEDALKAMEMIDGMTLRRKRFPPFSKSLKEAVISPF